MRSANFIASSKKQFFFSNGQASVQTDFQTNIIIVDIFLKFLNSI